MCACLSCTLSTGDVVELKNGDRLTGDIKNLATGKLTLVTEYAGKLVINWSQVNTLSTSKPLIVELKSGPVSIGLIHPATAGKIVMGSDDQEVSVFDVASIREQPKPKQALFSDWHGNLDFGYTVHRGNTWADNLAINFQPIRITQKDRIRIPIQTLYSFQDGTTANSRHRARLRYDRFLSLRTFLFLVGLVETDIRELLDFRTSQGGGFGFQLQPASHTRISFFGGTTFLQENFQGTDTELRAQGLAGLEVESSRWPPLKISTKGQIFPLLNQARFRMEWDASLRWPIVAGFTFGLQFFEDFDSNPPQAGVRKNDIGLISSLGMTF